jgi:hypothetical protein
MTPPAPRSRTDELEGQALRALPASSRIRVICAWCRRPLARLLTGASERDTTVSHGLCPACVTRLGRRERC